MTKKREEEERVVKKKGRRGKGDKTGRGLYNNFI